MARLGLQGRTLERALELAGEGPDRAAWTALLRRLLLFAGAALVLAGVICFFAFNWQGLHRFGKFALAGGGVLVCALGAWRLGLERTPAKLLLLAASVLVGVWLAIHGQAYQTGADAYELFRGWALLVLPWVLAARFQPLWALWGLLLNLWLGLGWEQTGAGPNHLLPAAYAALNLGGWAAWELAAGRMDWLRGRWLPRLLALGSLAALTAPALVFLAETRHPRGLWTVPASAALVLAMLALFRRVRRDLFMVTLALAAAIALLTTGLGRLLVRNALGGDGCAAFLLLGLLLVAQVGGATAWLRRLARETP